MAEKAEKGRINWIKRKQPGEILTIWIGSFTMRRIERESEWRKRLEVPPSEAL